MSDERVNKAFERARERKRVREREKERERERGREIERGERFGRREGCAREKEIEKRDRVADDVKENTKCAMVPHTTHTTCIYSQQAKGKGREGSKRKGREGYLRPSEPRSPTLSLSPTLISLTLFL